MLADFSGSFFSTTKCPLDLQSLETPYNAHELIEALKEQALLRIGGLRCFYFESTVAQGICYIDGERVEFGALCADAVISLCDEESLDFSKLASALTQEKFVDALITWVNAGYWYFDD